MKRMLDSLLAVASFIVMGAGLVLMLVLAFRASGGGGATGLSQGYPPPEATELPPIGYPAPQVTAVPTISPAERTAIEATVIAEATASAPAPIPTAGPVMGPQTIYDPFNHFSLRLLSGWHAWVPSGEGVAGVTVMFNYDEEKVSDRLGTPPPPGWLKIQISAGPLKPGQSFEQWLSDWRAFETSPDSGAFGVTLTEPQPYKLGRYDGVSFVGTDINGGSVLEIDMPWGEGQVMVIGLSPSDSPSLPEALSMLSAIEFSLKPLP